MTLTRPTRRELVEKLRAAIMSRLPEEQLRRSDAEVYSRAFAATADAIYSLVAYYHRQQFVWSCDSEYLDRHAGLYGITRFPAAKAAGKVRFGITGDAVVPAGAELQSAAGASYVTTADSDPAGVAAVEAAVAGSAGNLAENSALSLTSPVEGVAAEAIVSSAISGGEDAESDDRLRSRTLVKMRETPQGGAAADYKTWALQVPGVTRAWCYPEEDGEGTVTVRFACDGLEQIVPTEEMVAKVRAHINELRPVCAKVTVVAPVAHPVPITFRSLGGDSVATRSAIESDLRRFFRDETEPGGVVHLSQINAVISNASGETDHVITEPAADVIPGAGQIPTLGEITWP